MRIFYVFILFKKKKIVFVILGCLGKEWDFIRVGFCHGGILSGWDFVMVGFCPGGMLSGGILSVHHK